MATYYWIGGNGTWDNSSKTNWSTISGGAGGSGPPISTDTVIFDANSGTGICTTAAGSACATATLNSSTLGLTLGANHTMSGTFTLTLGTLSLGANTLTCSVFSSSNSNARSIAFGTGNITVTGSGVQVVVINIMTNFTYTGTSNIICNYAGSTGTRTIRVGSSGGGSETNALSVYVTAGSDALSNAGFFKNLDFTGYSGVLTVADSNYVYGNLTFGSGMSIVATTNIFALNATSGTQLVTTNNVTIDAPISKTGVGATVQLQDNLTIGSTRTFNLLSGGLNLNGKNLTSGFFVSNNTSVRSITSGAGQFYVTGNSGTVFTIANDTNLTLADKPTVNATYSGSTGTRTIGGGSSLTAANAININVTAGSDTITLASSSNYTNINFTGFSGTFSNSVINVYGNYTLSSGMTLTSGTNATTFQATSGTQQITTNNKTLDFPITFNGVGGTFAFQDALTLGSTRALTLTNGTVKLKAGVTSTVGSFATSGTNQKYLQSTLAGSQATLSDASGTNSLSYTTIQDIFATGGATWNAYYANGNIDGGNNTNWNFGGTPSYDAEYGYKLRSFTETGRF